MNIFTADLESTHMSLLLTNEAKLQTNIYQNIL